MDCFSSKIQLMTGYTSTTIFISYKFDAIGGRGGYKFDAIRVRTQKESKNSKGFMTKVKLHLRFIKIWNDFKRFEMRGDKTTITCNHAGGYCVKPTCTFANINFIRSLLVCCSLPCVLLFENLVFLIFLFISKVSIGAYCFAQITNSLFHSNSNVVWYLVNRSPAPSSWFAQIYRESKRFEKIQTDSRFVWLRFEILENSMRNKMIRNLDIASTP